MRIIGQIDHPIMKITVFRTDGKVSVKFETGGQYEQIYKFWESEELKTFEDMQKFIDQPFMDFVQAEFTKMHKAKNEATNRFMPQQGHEDFEVII